MQVGDFMNKVSAKKWGFIKRNVTSRYQENIFHLSQRTLKEKP
jgi:hypothetical protein